MGRFAASLAVLLIAAASGLGAEEYEPVVPGPEGQRAFDELAAYYADRNKVPAYAQALRNLRAADEDTRAVAGRYLLALFKQAYEDETTGRTPVRRLPYWGGGVGIAARELRTTVAKAFGDAAQGEEALDAAVWLIEGDQLAESTVSGVRVLRRTESAAVTPIFRRLLAQPHPNKDVVEAVLEEAVERDLKDLAPEVVRLSTYYRTSIREAARDAAVRLGVKDLPEFKPETAFTPCLDEQVRAVASMVMAPIGEDDRWTRFTVTYPPQREGEEERVRVFSAWLLDEDDTTYHVVGRFGEESRLKKEVATTENRTLAEDVAVLLKARALMTEALSIEDPEKHMSFCHSPEYSQAESLFSRWGALTAQFEARYLSVPEALLGAWSYVRGDRSAAAALLFPRLDAMADERWFRQIIRDSLGNLYHQTMLEAFSHERDYDRALALAQHLSKPAFDGYRYQERAKRLSEQLAQRSEEFHTLVLPPPDDWEHSRAQMDRTEQIAFLAQRLRLLNCIQHGQPGDVDYRDQQFSRPEKALQRDFSILSVDDYQELIRKEGVINPYTELTKMELTVSELPALVPYLADEVFMPTFSFWRDFHPDRTLHQVNWAVARIVNATAHRDLAQLRTYEQLDEIGKKHHLAEITAWCRANAEKSPAELVVQTLLEATTFREFEAAATDAVRSGTTQALPALLQREADFSGWREQIAEFAYGLNTSAAVPRARAWVRDDEEGVRFWAALILLRHGDTDRSEGLPELRAVLQEGDGTWRYSQAIEPLLSIGREECLQLACGILKTEGFKRETFGQDDVLRRLFLAGRRECLDFLIGRLDDTEPYGSRYGMWQGEEVERQQVIGDDFVRTIAYWRTDTYEYHIFAPDEVRAEEREQLKAWLREQFDLIASGQEPDFPPEPEFVPLSPWELDVP